jgi:hypothetical protein
MISNRISLSHDKKKASFSHTTLLSIKRIFKDHVKLQFLQQSTEYLGSTLSRQEIESLLVQKR